MELPDQNFVENGVLGKFLPCGLKNCIQLSARMHLDKFCTPKYFCDILIAPGFLLRRKTLWNIKEGSRITRLQRWQFIFCWKSIFTDDTLFLNRNDWSTSIFNKRCIKKNRVLWSSLHKHTETLWILHYSLY